MTKIPFLQLLQNYIIAYKKISSENFNDTAKLKLMDFLSAFFESAERKHLASETENIQNLLDGFLQLCPLLKEWKQFAFLSKYLKQATELAKIHFDTTSYLSYQQRLQPFQRLCQTHIDQPLIISDYKKTTYKETHAAISTEIDSNPTSHLEALNWSNALFLQSQLALPNSQQETFLKKQLLSCTEQEVLDCLYQRWLRVSWDLISAPFEEIKENNYQRAWALLLLLKKHAVGLAAKWDLPLLNALGNLSLIIDNHIHEQFNFATKPDKNLFCYGKYADSPVQQFRSRLTSIRASFATQDNKLAAQKHFTQQILSLAAEIAEDSITLLGPVPKGLSFIVVGLGASSEQRLLPYGPLSYAIVSNRNDHPYLKYFKELLQLSFLSLNDPLIDHDEIKTGILETTLRHPIQIYSSTKKNNHFYQNYLKQWEKRWYRLEDLNQRFDKKQARNEEEQKAFVQQLDKAVLKSFRPRPEKDYYHCKAGKTLLEYLNTQFNNYLTQVGSSEVIDLSDIAYYYTQAIQSLCLYSNIPYSTFPQALQALVAKDIFDATFAEFAKYQYQTLQQWQIDVQFANKTQKLEIQWQNLNAQEIKNIEVLLYFLLYPLYEAVSTITELKKPHQHTHEIRFSATIWEALFNYLQPKITTGENGHQAFQRHFSNLEKGLLPVPEKIQLYDIHPAVKAALCFWDGTTDKFHEPSTDSKQGNRPIYKLNYCGLKCHLKLIPEIPGYEYAVWQLHELLGSHGVAASQLLKVKINNINYPVLISRTVIGNDLHTMFAKHPDFIGQLDHYSYSKLLIATLLVNPGDMNENNLFVEAYYTDNNKKKYRLVGIDNDRAFVEAVSYSKKEEPVTIQNETTTQTQVVTQLRMKSILYCFPHQMKEPLDQKAIDEFLAATESNLLLTHWLEKLAAKDSDYQELFKEEALNLLDADYTAQLIETVTGSKPEQTGHKVHIATTLRQDHNLERKGRSDVALVGTLSKLYSKIEQLRTLFKWQENTANFPNNIIPLEALAFLEPAVGEDKQYRDVLSQALSPLQIFKQLMSPYYAKRAVLLKEEVEKQVTVILNELLPSPLLEDSWLAVTEEEEPKILIPQGAQLLYTKHENGLYYCTYTYSTKVDPRSCTSMLHDGLGPLSLQIVEQDALDQQQKSSLDLCLEENMKLQQSFSSWENIRESFYKGETTSLSKFQNLPQPFQLRFINNLNLSKIKNVKIQEALVKSLSAIRCLELNLQNASFLTTAHLKNILKNASSLRFLNISGCSRLSEGVLNKLAKLEGLKHLEANNCNFRTFGYYYTFFKATKRLKFLNLYYLSLQNCANLVEIVTYTPNLHTLKLNQAKSLVRIQTQSEVLRSIDLTNCQKLPQKCLVELGQRNDWLQEIKLTGCEQLKHTTVLEKYPPLIYCELERYSHTFIQALEKQLDDTLNEFILFTEGKSLILQHLLKQLLLKPILWRFHFRQSKVYKQTIEQLKQLSQQTSLLGKLYEQRHIAALALIQSGEIIHTPVGINILIKAVTSNKENEIIQGSKLLLQLGATPYLEPEIVEQMLAALLEAIKNNQVAAQTMASQAFAQLAISHLGHERLNQAYDTLLEAVSGDVVLLGEAICQALAQLEPKLVQILAVTIKGLINAFNFRQDSAWHIKEKAESVLEPGTSSFHFQPQELNQVLAGLLLAMKENYLDIRIAAIKDIGSLAETHYLDLQLLNQVLTALLEAVKDDNYDTRQVANQALEQLAKTPCLEPEILRQIVANILDSLNGSNELVYVTIRKMLYLLIISPHLDLQMLHQVLTALLLAMKSKNRYVESAARMAILRRTANQNHGSLAIINHIEPRVLSLVLAVLLKTEKANDWRVKNAATQALDQLATIEYLEPQMLHDVIDALFEAIKARNPEIRDAANQALRQLLMALPLEFQILNQVLSVLLKVVNANNSEVRKAANQTLNQLINLRLEPQMVNQMLSVLLQAIKDNNSKRRKAASKILSQLATAPHLEPPMIDQIVTELLQTVENNNQDIEDAARAALNQLVTEPHLSAERLSQTLTVLLKAATDSSQRTKHAAREALESLANLPHLDTERLNQVLAVLFKSIIENPDWKTRQAASRVLGQLASKPYLDTQILNQVLTTLFKAIKDINSKVRKEASYALAQLIDCSPILHFKDLFKLRSFTPSPFVEGANYKKFMDRPIIIGFNYLVDQINQLAIQHLPPLSLNIHATSFGLKQAISTYLEHVGIIIDFIQVEVQKNHLISQESLLDSINQWVENINPKLVPNLIFINHTTHWSICILAACSYTRSLNKNNMQIFYLDPTGRTTADISKTLLHNFPKATYHPMHLNFKAPDSDSGWWVLACSLQMLIHGNTECLNIFKSTEDIIKLRLIFPDLGHKPEKHLDKQQEKTIPSSISTATDSLSSHSSATPPVGDETEQPTSSESYFVHLNASHSFFRIPKSLRISKEGDIIGLNENYPKAAKSLVHNFQGVLEISQNTWAVSLVRKVPRHKRPAAQAYFAEETVRTLEKIFNEPEEKKELAESIHELKKAAANLQSINPEHAFLILEGFDRYNRGIILRIDLFQDLDNSKKALIKIQKKVGLNYAETREDSFSRLSREFEEDMLNNAEICYLTWYIDRKKAKTLYDQILADQQNPPDYSKWGNESYLVPHSSSLIKIHSCFTWCREKLMHLNDASINADLKPKWADIFVSMTSLYLKEDANEKDINLLSKAAFKITKNEFSQ